MALVGGAYQALQGRGGGKKGLSSLLMTSSLEPQDEDLSYFRVGGAAASPPVVRLDVMGPAKHRLRLVTSVLGVGEWMTIEVSLGDKKSKDPVKVRGRARMVQGKEDAVLDVEMDGQVVTGLTCVLLKNAKHSSTLHVFSSGKLDRLLYQMDWLVPDYKAKAGGRATGGGVGLAVLSSPMPGKVVRVLVKPGDSVEASSVMVVIEAMKMEFAVRAPRAGKVKEVMVAAGGLVGDGADLCSME